MHALFTFSRRINRATYFAGLILGFICLMLAILILSVISFLMSIKAIHILEVVMIITSAVAYMYYALCLTKQRANDISGENALLFTILAIFILGVIIGVIPGEKRPNRYGKIPKPGLALK